MFACSMYPGDDRLRRERPPRGDRERPAAAQPPQPRAVGGQQRERGGLEAVGLADQVRAEQEGPGPHLGRLQARVPRGAAGGRRGRGSGALLHAQLAQRERRQGAAQQEELGRHALLGRVARREPVRGVRRQHLALHERIRLPVVPRPGVGQALHGARRQRLEHREPGDAVAPAPPARQPADPHVHGARLPQAEGLRVVPLRRPGAAGHRHQVRGGGAPARDGPQLGQPLLAARRLLAGRLVVQHRLLRALEGGAVLRAQVLRARAGQPGRREGRRVDLGRLRSARRRARAVDRAADRLLGQRAEALRSGHPAGGEREPQLHDVQGKRRS